MKKITILGSTGSIGTQTLDVIKDNSDKLCVHALVAFSNKQLLHNQCQQFGCDRSYLIASDGVDCLLEAVKGCDIVVVATRGIVALDAVMYCIEHDIDIAIANKEVLVTAGGIVMSALKNSKSRLLPVDSEHSAIWQCVNNSNNDIDTIYLTASGGALYNLSAEQVSCATADMALRHPNWSMGSKITIDSATMMNKALEIVEACWLFDVSIDNVTIVVHRQSIVHSMVKFADNSVIAQMSCPDMKLPIQYALLYPHRQSCDVPQLDIFAMDTLTFEQCDYNKFPCATLAKTMLDSSAPLMATVVNACNDMCVESFLNGDILCGDIYNIIIKVSNSLYQQARDMLLTVDNIKYMHQLAYQTTKKYIMEKSC